MPVVPNDSEYKHEAPMSKMVTTVPPCNPFNHIEQPETIAHWSVSIDVWKEIFHYYYFFESLIPQSRVFLPLQSWLWKFASTFCASCKFFQLRWKLFLYSETRRIDLLSSLFQVVCAICVFFCEESSNVLFRKITLFLISFKSSYLFKGMNRLLKSKTYTYIFFCCEWLQFTVTCNFEIDL